MVVKAGVCGPRTVNEGVENELPVLLDEVVDVSEDAAHFGCEIGLCEGRGWGRERGRWARGSMAARAERSEERAGEVEGYDGMGVGLDRPALNECKRLAGSNEMGD